MKLAAYHKFIIGTTILEFPAIGIITSQLIAYPQQIFAFHIPELRSWDNILGDCLYEIPHCSIPI